MNEAKEVLWRRIQPVLGEFAERIARSDLSVHYVVENSSNDAFLLRAYAALRKKTSDDEIALTADAALKAGQIFVSADICMDTGEVIAEGPKATISLSDIQAPFDSPLTEWLGRLEHFLTSIESAVRRRIALM